LYEKTKPELEDNDIDVKGLKPGELYEFVVVAVDGNIMRESDVVEIEASSTGNFLKLNKDLKHFILHIFNEFCYNYFYFYISNIYINDISIIHSLNDYECVLCGN